MKQSNKGSQLLGTYSLVVSWETIRSLLTLSIINGWNTRQINFVLAFPQAKPECDMYMEIPRGCNVGGSKSNYVLKLNKNLYGSKQASKLWFEHLRRGLRKRGFKQSKADECMFYKGDTIFVVYVDDGILIGPDKEEIDNIITSLKEDYDLTDEGNLSEYLGIKIEEQDDGSRVLTQPHLMKRILMTVGIKQS